MDTFLANVGVPNVPSGNLEQQSFFQWVRNTLVQLQASLIPPNTVTNLRATPQAGHIQIDFTRSDGDRYTLYSNSTPSLQLAVQLDLGTANRYVDDIGAGDITRFYAVQALKGNILGTVSSWVSATTLDLGVPIVPPDPPPLGDPSILDQETDSITIPQEFINA